MRILSIDIETTGINPKVNEILTIGILESNIEDGNKLMHGSFINNVFYKPTLTFSKTAYKINRELLDWYFENSDATTDEAYYNNIANTLFTVIGHMDDTTLIIGKNYAKFDRVFLLEAVERSTVNRPDKNKLKKVLDKTSYDIGVACLDIHADTKIPNTEECMDRLGIKVNQDIRHHSLYDAYLMTLAFAKLNNLDCFEMSDEVFKNKIIDGIEDVG